MMRILQHRALQIQGFHRALQLVRCCLNTRSCLHHELRGAGRRRNCSSFSISDVLSQVASDSCSRREFLLDVEKIQRIVSRSDWDPNSSGTLEHLGLRLTPEHVAEMIQAQPDPVWALRLFIWAGRQPGYKHNATVRGVIMKLWEHNQHFESFLDILDDTRDRNFLMSPERWTLLIKGYGWARMVDVAIGTFERMRNSGSTPDVCHFNSLLHALVRANRLKTIRHFHQQMLEAGISPNAATYALRVRGFCVAGQVEESLKLFFEMLQEGFCPDQLTFSELIDGLCKSNKVFRLYQVLYELNANGFTPDETIYHALLTGLCRNGNVRDAEKLVNRLMEKGVDPTATVYNILAKGLCRVKKVHNAHVLVNEMVKKGFIPDTDVFNLVVVLLFKEGKVGIVFRFVDKMMDKGFLPSVSSYNILIYGLSKYGEVRKAFEAWNILFRVRLPSVKSYRALLEGLCKAGRLAEAKLVFKKTMEKGGTLDAVAHDRLLHRFRQAGKFDDVKEFMDIMEAKGCIFDDHTYTLLGAENKLNENNSVCDSSVDCTHAFLGMGKKSGDSLKYTFQGPENSSDENSSNDDDTGLKDL